MASIVSPYGLKPINLIGGQSFNGGAPREYSVIADTTAFFLGDMISVSSAGLLARVTTSPTTGTTAGIIGVCAGVRYVNPGTKQSLWAQYLPANATTAGFTDIYVYVWDDPDQVYQIQGSAALGTFASGTAGSAWRAAIGKNAAIGTTAAPTNTVPGVSGVSLTVGSNGAGITSAAAGALRILDFVRGTELDAYPEFIVKFNHGAHSYYFSTGV
jgi:hypothetical protein